MKFSGAEGCSPRRNGLDFGCFHLCINAVNLTNIHLILFMVAMRVGHVWRRFSECLPALTGKGLVLVMKGRVCASCVGGCLICGGGLSQGVDVVILDEWICGFALMEGRRKYALSVCQLWGQSASWLGGGDLGGLGVFGIGVELVGLGDVRWWVVALNMAYPRQGRYEESWPDQMNTQNRNQWRMWIKEKLDSPDLCRFASYPSVCKRVCTVWVKKSP